MTKVLNMLTVHSVCKMERMVLILKLGKRLSQGDSNRTIFLLRSLHIEWYVGCRSAGNMLSVSGDLTG